MATRSRKSFSLELNIHNIKVPLDETGYSVRSTSSVALNKDLFINLLEKAYFKVEVKNIDYATRYKSFNPWLDENLTGRFYIEEDFTNGKCQVFFEKQEDMVKFALTFLDEDINKRSNGE